MSDFAILEFTPVDRFSVKRIGTNTLGESTATENRAAELLEAHPHFRGRGRWVQCRFSDRRLYLTGKVPSYYLKQLAQEAVRDLEDVDLVVNRIEVVNPAWQADRFGIRAKIAPSS